LDRRVSGDGTGHAGRDDPPDFRGLLPVSEISGAEKD